MNKTSHKQQEWLQEYGRHLIKPPWSNAIDDLRDYDVEAVILTEKISYTFRGDPRDWMKKQLLEGATVWSLLNSGLIVLGLCPIDRYGVILTREEFEAQTGS